MPKSLVATVLIILGLVLFSLADHCIRSRDRKNLSWDAREDRDFINMPIYARYATLLWCVLLVFDPSSWYLLADSSWTWNVARALAAAGVVSFVLGLVIGFAGYNIQPVS
jgi:hypothetical protein